MLEPIPRVFPASWGGEAQWKFRDLVLQNICRTNVSMRRLVRSGQDVDRLVEECGGERGIEEPCPSIVSKKDHQIYLSISMKIDLKFEHERNFQSLRLLRIIFGGGHWKRTPIWRRRRAKNICCLSGWAARTPTSSSSRTSPWTARPRAAGARPTLFFSMYQMHLENSAFLK